MRLYWLSVYSVLEVIRQKFFLGRCFDDFGAVYVKFCAAVY